MRARVGRIVDPARTDAADRIRACIQSEGRTAMEAEANGRLAQRFFDEVMNGMDPTAAEEILAPEFATHHPNFPVARGPEGVLGVLNLLRSAIPDLEYAVQETIADDANL